ncbi:MAG: ABC transporter ATP-binding protein [Ktedonobacterales bacterium]|nr:ABC transporter ATP-binding protein [Ktedonobacterales bacterium]
MAEPTATAIDVANLVKRYPKAATNAVDDVSFTVGRGEIFGLLGPNGAGKTTTIGVLTTSVVPTAGRAHIMGFDVASDPISTKQRIAIVPQQSNLDRSLRAREILTFHAAYHGVPRKEREARADALLQEMGLGDRGKDKLTRYSGGMAQRLMIARALMHSPDVLFLDEPTNNLDPQSRLFLWDRIKQLNAQGMTILLTTHDMDEADQLCQRIAIMDHGKILHMATSAELKKTIPGATALELRVRQPERVLVGAPAAEPASNLLAALRDIPGVSKAEQVALPAGEVAQDGVAQYRLYAEDAGALIVPATQAIGAHGAELRDLHQSRPSLEDVFIYLTGRNLR